MRIMEKVLDPKNIHLAYLRVVNGSMNKELIIEAEKELFHNSIPGIYKDIRKALMSPDKFKFGAVEPLHKPKYSHDSGEFGTRTLVRVNFFDSVIVQCVINVIAEQIKSLMPVWNYGYKIVSNAESPYFYQDWRTGYAKFIKHELELIESHRYISVIETDIEKFYPSINHQKLINELKPYFTSYEDVELLFVWIKKILNMYFETEYNHEKIGLPQGPLHSPLFALFYIRDCFKEITKKYPRVNCFGYVDDLRVYSEYSLEITEKIFDTLKNYMVRKGLTLNENKTLIARVSEHKVREAELMSKASNLGRAIRDEVVISSEGIEEMRERLKNLIHEIEEIYSEEDFYSEDSKEDDGPNNNKKKLTERLQKFVDYRLVKLIDSNDDWYQQLESAFADGYLLGNIVAIWQILSIKAETIGMKRAFLSKLREVALSNETQAYSYVRFLAFKYLFKYSPSELRLSDDEVTSNFVVLLRDNKKTVFEKAILSSLHKDWIPYISNIFNWEESELDSELASLYFKNELVKNPPTRYRKYISSPRLVQNKEELIFESSNIITTNHVKYLEDEDFKNIRFRLLKYVDGNWRVKINGRIESLRDISWRNDSQIRDLLKNLVAWLKIQIIMWGQRVPSSIVDPDHIWLDMSTDHVYLLGNPAWQLDYIFEETPSSLWKKSFTSLFQVLFNIDLSKGINIFKKSWTSAQSPLLYFWQYRILNYLFSNKFSLFSFIIYMEKVLSEEEDNTIVSAEQIKLDHIVKHYVTDVEHRDNLIIIANFVEGSWKNGSKECYFFTLHNHEHARYLIYRLHEIFERTGFSIYLNSKEAFRLFAACFLHDIGMLSEPAKYRLYDIREDDIQNLQDEVNQILQVAVARDPDDIKLDLQQIYEIFSNVERVRESIVRNEHPNISEKELVGDFPELPLSVAERRDIGIISVAHGWNKDKVKNITDDLHDGRHPIHLRLLSLLLRIADLSDVSKERIRREVLERNHHRMSTTSVFHWIKHLSVDKLTIEHRESENGITNIIFTIHHNYLPSGYILTQVLEDKCGAYCKRNDSNELKNFIVKGKNLGSGSYYNYFEPTNCDITCAFINESYRSFFEEIIFINEYFSERDIPVQFDLKIVKSDHSQVDFYFVKNRNNAISAQDFMFQYFQRLT